MTDNGNGGGKPQTVLVVGGTGRTGRRVAARLAARGAAVRIGSRSARPRFDWADSGSWGPALHGAEAAYLVLQPDVGAPGVAETLREFAARAVESGVRRLVLLSARGEEAALPAERAVRESGAEWAVLRCSWFCQNFSEGALREYVDAGTLPFPAGQVREPFIDAEDIAEVAAAVLLSDASGGLLGRVHELTGPRALTWAEAVAEITRASGREVRYVAVPAREYGAELLRLGVPEPEAAFLTALFEQLLDGRNAGVTDGVRRVLGREPREFGAFVRGVWGPAARVTS
ncbi:NmrA family transcriptional regulator [Streptomyces sp. ODS28]|uniref:NmrA family transcriptional regulator n=1 Tax=Streptomyces sp. ODS28 TaxID=3136688 RepID=UPI0031EE0BE9